MGMAASQCRFLQLTQRNNDIGRKLTSLSMDKVRLSQDMNKVTKTYQQAMNAKALKWSNNNGKTYVDMSYSNLMTPNAYNNNVPYLITDTRGRVVVDSKYKKYAEMISPNGAPNPNWEDSRSEIISELTGISPDVIENLDGYKAAIQDNKDEVARLLCAEPENTRYRQTNVATLASKMGNCLGISDWQSAYNKNSTISGSLENIVDTIKYKLSRYFADDEDKFKAACETVKKEHKGDDIKVKDILQEIFGAFAVNGGDTRDDGDNINPVWYDVDTPAYQDWKKKHDEWEQQLKLAEQAYQDALDAKTMVCTSADEKLIEFYDTIFSAIAENGWSYNSKVSDTDYLNQLLQNNVYMVTTVDRNYNKNDDGSYSYANKYDTDIACNCKKVFSVNDSPARDNALVNYEKEKSIINAKETRIDTRMKNLETEQSAIQNMIKSIQETINNNIQQHMNVFQG